VKIYFAIHFLINTLPFLFIFFGPLIFAVKGLHHLFRQVFQCF